MLSILFVVMVIAILAYLVIGASAIALCEIIASKTGSCNMPEWAESLQDFITEKWFFIYR